MDSSSGLKSNTSKEEQTRGTKAELRLRCPSCYKLFALDPDTVYVKRPEFDCSKCNQKFWISFPEALEYSEVVAFPVEWQEDFEPEVDTDKIIGETLDPAIVEKIAEDIATKVETSDFEEISNVRKVGFIDDYNGEVNSEDWFIEKSWEKVLNNYDTKSAHKEFIHFSQSQKGLDFAYRKYKNFVEANPHDPIAKEMLTYTENLIQGHSINEGALSREKKKRRYYRKSLPWVVVLIASGLIFVGFVSQDFSNLAGIGFALIFLTGALSLLKESNL